jgi:hypothetical protein
MPVAWFAGPDASLAGTGQPPGPVARMRTGLPGTTAPPPIPQPDSITSIA